MPESIPKIRSYGAPSAWVEANTTLDSAAGEFVVPDSYPEDVSNGYPTYAVTLTVYLSDGRVAPRKTYFTSESNGYWAHWLTDEETGMFDSAVGLLWTYAGDRGTSQQEGSQPLTPSCCPTHPGA